MTDEIYHRATQDHIATMGRIGDNDVHAAYVEFRAKESDKVGRRFCSCIDALDFTVLLYQYAQIHR